MLKLLLLTCPRGPTHPSCRGSAWLQHAATGTGAGPTPCSASICGKTYQRSLGFTCSDKGELSAHLLGETA